MNCIAFIKPSLQSLIIGQTFLVLLVVLLIALFYYSTPYSRRQPIFILNVFAIAVALTTCLTAHILLMDLILSPQNMGLAQARLVIANIFFGTFQGMLADTILLVRLIAVHPLSRIGSVRFAFLISLPITLKVARVLNLAMFTIRMSSLANGPNGFVAIAESGWLTGSNMKVEWVVQVLDNSYVSVAFLWTIRAFSTASTVPSSFMSVISLRQSPFSERIRILFNLALSNYLIPTIMSIVQLGFAFRLGAAGASIMNEITYVNTMVSVFGVAFATVWAAREHRREMSPKRRCTCRLEEWRAHAPTVDTTNVESLENGKTSSGTSDRAKFDL